MSQQYRAPEIRFPRHLSDEAACVGSSIDFIEIERKQDHRHLARAYCNVCPVKQACLDWALQYEEYGIWGGLTERERNALRNGDKLTEDDERPFQWPDTLPEGDPRHGRAVGYTQHKCRCDDCRGWERRRFARRTAANRARLNQAA